MNLLNLFNYLDIEWMRNIENITNVHKIIYYIQNKTNYLNMD